MKIVNFLIIAVVALLSIAAGVAKVMQAPQEMEFLQSVGLSKILIMAFGLFSILPIVLAGIVIYQSARITHNKPLNTDAGKAGTG